MSVAPSATSLAEESVPAPIRPERVFDMLDRAVAAHPGRVAIDFLGRRWRYRALGRLVARAAAGLQRLGIGPGDRVGLCLPNTPHFPILYFAALKAGAAVVSINPLYVERELEHIIRDAGMKLVAVPDLAAIHGKVAAVAEGCGLGHILVCPLGGVLPRLQGLGFRLFKRRERARIPADGRHLSFTALTRGRRPLHPVTVSPDDLAVLQYTGGTTGFPKGAMLTHANLTANTQQTLAFLGGSGTEQERIVGVLPLFHVFALTTVLNFAVAAAAMMVLLPRFDLDQLLATIARTRPTYLPAVPTIYAAIDRAAATRRIDFSSLRHCISGGAPLPVEVKQRFERLTGAHVVEGYGLSESSPIITCSPLGGLNKDGSAGPAYPFTTIEIHATEAPFARLGPGERGEVCARGPQVMRGYWNQPEETARVLSDDGLLRTGDIGYLDEDGYLFLVDRIKDVILCGGYNVYPRMIEDALYEHPAIAEAIVIGVPDPYRGQSPKAFVVLRGGTETDPRAIRAFLESRLSKIERPGEIEIRGHLPRTLIGKLSKKALVEEEEARRAAAAARPAAA